MTYNKKNRKGTLIPANSPLDAYKILLVEDDSVTAALIKKFLSGSRYSLAGTVSAGEKVMEKIEELQPQLVLMDITLIGEKSGIDAAMDIKKSGYNTPVVFLTANTDMKHLRKAQDASPYGFISKPCNKESLLFNIEMAFNNFNRDIMLAKNEEMMKHFFNSATDAIVILDNRLTILYANDEFNKILDRSNDNFLGMNLTMIYPDIDKHLGIQKLTSVIETGSPIEEEIRIGNIPGLERFLHVKAFKVGDGVGMIIDDISREKLAEIHLRKSEAKYSDLLKNTNIGTLIYNRDFSINYINPAAEHFFGNGKWIKTGNNNKRSVQILRFHRSDGSLLNPDEYPVNRVLETGKPFNNSEIGLELEPGYIKWVISSSYPIFDSDNNIEQVVATFIDVTDFREASEQIVRAEKLYSTILSNITDMIFRIDTNGIVTYINETAKVLYKIDVDDISLLSLDFPFFWCGDSIDKVRNTLMKVMEIKYNLSVNCRCGDRIYELVIIPVLENGKVESLIAAASDITIYKQDRDNLKSALNSSVLITVRIVEAKDPYTAGHQENVARLAKAIAIEMGLPENIVETIWSSSLVHDIGKIDIPSEILSKPGKLSEIEFELIKVHPDTAYRILKDQYPYPFPDIVRQHHEKYDGSGYPRGLKGDEILLEAKIITVADVIEAMASDRPYRPGLGIERALGEITTNMNIYYDPKVSVAAVNLFRNKEFKF